jgi:hypothetical protein
MPSSETDLPDAKVFLYKAGTLVISLHWTAKDEGATVRLAATFKDHCTEQAVVQCSNRRMAETYFEALELPDAARWWDCLSTGARTPSAG